MLVIMKKQATENELDRVKQLLVEKDCDFHQSTGANRTILGVVGDTSSLDREQLLQTAGVLDIYHIPDEE